MPQQSDRQPRARRRRSCPAAAQALVGAEAATSATPPAVLAGSAAGAAEAISTSLGGLAATAEGMAAAYFSAAVARDWAERSVTLYSEYIGAGALVVLSVAPNQAKGPHAHAARAVPRGRLRGQLWGGEGEGGVEVVAVPLGRRAFGIPEAPSRRGFRTLNPLRDGVKAVAGRYSEVVLGLLTQAEGHELRQRRMPDKCRRPPGRLVSLSPYPDTAGGVGRYQTSCSLVARSFPSRRQ
jgi:hypothetical protein